MCCKLIMNLVEGVTKHSNYDATARDLAIKMLRIITLKLRTVAKIQLPSLQKN